MDSKDEIDNLYGNLSKKIGCLKKITLKMNFGCESCAIFKKA